MQTKYFGICPQHIKGRLDLNYGYRLKNNVLGQARWLLVRD
jgi:hypothetical protein